ncbi:MAG: hypothetical protein AAGE52_15560 [Myxococcota bacterium]
MDDLPLPDLEDPDEPEGLAAAGPATPGTSPLSPPGRSASPQQLLPAFDELPAQALETDGDGDTYAVYLLGFLRDSEVTAAKLASLFGLDELTAESLMASAPVAVKRGASRETASQLERALRGIGADVDIRPEGDVKPLGRQPDRRDNASMEKAKAAIASQNLAAQASLPPELVKGMANAPPSVVRAVAPAVADELLSQGEHPGFWSRVPVAFVVPFLGTGLLWLGGLGVAALGVGFVRLAPCIGFFMMPFAAAIYLGLLGAYFGQAAQTGLDDEGGGLPKPRWRLPERSDLYARGGALLLLSFLLFGIPAVLLQQGFPPVMVYLVGLLPYAYWPVALTVAGITGSLLNMFNPFYILKGIWAGGVPYLVVAVTGFLVQAFLTSLPVLLLPMGLGAALLGALAVIGGIGYTAGVQGYLMGCIVGSRYERFEGLLR